MTFWEFAAIALAGMGAGAINALVGSGTLITFPTLLAFGVPPVTANVSNTIGLVPGSFSGVIGYRRELAGQRSRLIRLVPAAILGGTIGAVLLIGLPDGAFAAIVPALIVLGLVLVVTGPRLSRWVTTRHEARGGLPDQGAWWVWPAVLGTSVYGGYFGAAQGIIHLAVLGIGVQDTLQRLNGTKNVLAAMVNLIAGIVFVVVADVDWWIVLVIGVASVVGAQLGARYGRRLPDQVLRWTVVAVGLVALTVFLLQ